MPGFAKMPTFSERESQTFAKKRSSGQIPEELKQAGQQVLEGLDWEIRFLEQQFSEASDSKERKDLEEALRSKREEYHSVIDRLDL